MELPQATLLRPFVTKHRPRVEPFQWKLVLQATRHHCPRHAGGSFRAQGQAVATFVLERVHLLGNHVRGFTQGALKHFGKLEHWRFGGFIAVVAGNISRLLDDVQMRAGIVTKQIARSAHGLQFGHSKPLERAAIQPLMANRRRSRPYLRRFPPPFAQRVRPGDRRCWHLAGGDEAAQRYRPDGCRGRRR